MKPVKLQNERGIAMMMTLVTMLLLSILAAELVYQNQVYTSIVFRQRDEFRARLLARSALRLGQLQLVATEKARKQIKNLGLGDASLADQIWQTPLILPPPRPPGLTLLDSQAIEAFKKSLGIEGSLSVTITGENDRLDLNQLVKVMPAGQDDSKKYGAEAIGKLSTPATQTFTPEQIKEARDKFRKTYSDILDQVFEKKRQDDESFRNKYQSLRAEDVLLNLTAFIDPQTKQDAENREKHEYYRGATPTPYSLKDAPLVSESELHMIKGMDDTIARLVADHFTVQATSSLDVNRASASMIRAIIPELTDDALDRLIKRRDDTTAGGHFKSADDFWNYLETLGTYGEAKKRLTEAGIQILGAETSYRIIVSAESGAARKSWLAYAGAMPALSTADKQEAQLQQQAAGQQPTFNNPNTNGQQGSGQKQDSKTDAKNSGESVRIIYLKAD